MDFGTLIMGHLLGDYILQNDWMARNKKNSSVHCFIHCALYTLAMAAVITMTGSSWPIWAYTVIFGTHFLQDRTEAVPKLMDWIGQKRFKQDLSPWSTIIVDNTIHLFVAFVLFVYLEKLI